MQNKSVITKEIKHDREGGGDEMIQDRREMLYFSVLMMKDIQSHD